MTGRPDAGPPGSRTSGGTFFSDRDAALREETVPDRTGTLAVAGLTWAGLSRVVTMAAQMVSVVILARMLSPREFGLVATSVTLINVISLGSFGFGAAALQKLTPPTLEELDVAWTYDNFIRNFVVALGLVAFAPALATYFNVPEGTGIIRSLAVITLLYGFENRALLVFTRKLDFRSRAFIDTANGAGLLISIVPLALWLRSPWAYIAAYCVSVVTKVAMSYVLYPRLPRINFSLGIARTFFRFGRWTALLGFLGSVEAQLPNVVIGGALGPASLGGYQVGSRLSTPLAGLLDQVTRRVFFPIYSRLQELPERISRNYLNALQGAVLVLFPLLIGLMIVAEPTIHVVFGRQWLSVVPVARVIPAVVMLRVIAHVFRPVFWGRGKPQREVSLMVFYLATATPLIYAGSRMWGLTGAAFGVLAAELLLMPLWFHLARRTVAITARQLLSALWSPALPIAAMAVCTLLVGQLLPAGTSSLVELIIMTCAGAVSYVGSVALSRRKFDWVALDVVLGQIGEKLHSRRKRQSSPNGTEHEQATE